MQALQDLGNDWPLLSAMLDVALALPSSERQIWLAALPPQHARLEATLRRLLALQSEVETENFLSTLPPLELSAQTSSIDEPQPGQRIGPYRLLTPIGQGGMGAVWQAERVEGQRWQTGRQVALKLPRLAWGNAVAERLARERDILATLEHPRIARLLDAGVDDRQRPYLAMELIDGQHIDRYCRERDLSLRQRIGLLLQVAEAVAHAHARLVVHRDLKPANILVSTDGQVHLLDFGIAKLMEGDRTHDTVLTQVSGRSFTPQYASPEQVRGEPLTTASDVYSLGVVAYELLAGALPYRLRRGSAAEIEAAIEAGDAPLASTQAGDAATRKALSGDIDAILNRALKRAAVDRYASVLALAEDLERHLRREPVLARPDSTGYRLRKFLQRHRVGVGASSALLLSVLIGGGMALWQAREARAQAERAEAEVGRQQAMRSLYLEAMSSLAARVAGDPTVLSDRWAVTHALRDTMRTMAPRYSQRPDEWHAILDSVMVQLNFAGDFEGSLAVGQEYLQHLKTHGAKAARVILVHSSMGRTLMQLGRATESEAVLRAGVAWAPDEKDARTEELRLYLKSDLGRALSNLGKRSEALQVLNQAEQTAARLPPGSNVRLDLLNDLSVVHAGFDDAASLHFARRAVAMESPGSTPPPVEKANQLMTLGVALLACGELAEAERVFAQAHSISSRLFGASQGGTLAALSRWSLALARQGRHEAARSLVLSARTGLAAQATPDSTAAGRRLALMDLENAYLEGNMERALSWIGPPDGSLPPGLRVRDATNGLAAEVAALALAGRGADALRLAESLRQAFPVEARPTAASNRIDLMVAQAQLAAGDPSSARQTLKPLIDTLRQLASPTNWTLRIARELAAVAAARGGDAQTALRELATVDKAAVAPSSVDRADSLLRQAEILAAAGQGAQAQAAGRAALADLKFQHPSSPRLAQARRAAGVGPSN